MGNPIQDWLNKFKKPTQTVSGTAKAGTTLPWNNRKRTGRCRHKDG